MNVNLSQEEIDALLRGDQVEPVEKPGGSVRPLRKSESAAGAEQAVPEEAKLTVRPVQYEELSAETTVDEPVAGMEVLLDVPLALSVELGRARCFVKDLLNLSSGSVVELDKAAGDPVDILINGKLFARGEVVVIDENFGVRIQEIVHRGNGERPGKK